jgi:hypothetical protein
MSKFTGRCEIVNTRTGEKYGSFSSLGAARKKCDQMNKEQGGFGGWFDVNMVKKSKPSDKLKSKKT